MTLRIKSLGSETDYPNPIGQAAAVIHNGTVYVIGGGSDAGVPQPACSIPIPVRFDPGHGQWTVLPQPPQPVYYAGAAQHDGMLYLVGGSAYGLRPDQREQRVLQIYDFTTQQWRIGPPPPFKLVGAGSTNVIGGKLYVCGGNRGDSVNPTYLVYVYDPIAETWTERPAPAFVVGTFYWTTVVGSKIYAVRRYSGQTDYVMDTASPDGQWRSIDLRVPGRATGTWYSGMINFSVIAFRHYILVIGGVRGNRDGVNDIWIYDTRIDTWTHGGNLAQPRGMAAVAVYSGDGPNGAFYVVGGRIGQSGRIVADAEVWVMIDEEDPLGSLSAAPQHEGDSHVGV